MEKWRAGRCDEVVNERARRRDQRVERHTAALEAARRADTNQRSHPEAQIERAGMDEQSFEHVLMPAHVGSSQPTGLVQMRTRSLEQFAASAEQSFSPSAADAPTIRVHRVAFRFLVRPRLRSPIGSLMYVRMVSVAGRAPWCDCDRK